MWIELDDGSLINSAFIKEVCVEDRTITDVDNNKLGVHNLSEDMFENDVVVPNSNASLIGMSCHVHNGVPIYSKTPIVAWKVCPVSDVSTPVFMSKPCDNEVSAIFDLSSHDWYIPFDLEGTSELDLREELAKRARELSVTPDMDVVAYMRDVDGTGSLHPCAKGDPGAFPVYRR